MPGRAHGEPVVGRFAPFEQHEREALRSDDVARVNHQPPQAGFVSGRSAAINSSCAAAAEVSLSAAGAELVDELAFIEPFPMVLAAFCSACGLCLTLPPSR